MPAEKWNTIGYGFDSHDDLCAVSVCVVRMLLWFSHTQRILIIRVCNLVVLCVVRTTRPFCWDATQCTCAIVVVWNLIYLKLTDGVDAADHKTLYDFLLSVRFYFASLFHYSNKRVRLIYYLLEPNNKNILILGDTQTENIIQSNKYVICWLSVVNWRIVVAFDISTYCAYITNTHSDWTNRLHHNKSKCSIFSSVIFFIV